MQDDWGAVPSCNINRQIEGDLRINAFRYDAELSFRAHRHDVYSLIFCFSGARETVQNACHERQTEGEIIVVSPGVWHSSRYSLENGATEGISLEVPWRVLSKALSSRHHRAYSRELLLVNGKTRNRRAELLARDLRELSLSNFCGSRAASITERICELLMNDWPTSLLRSDSVLPPQQLPRHAFLTAVEYLTACPRAHLDWEKLSRDVGMSYSRFRVLFKRSTRMSPGQFYNALLMEKARKYLRSSDLAANEIANKLGFASSSHFGQFFREHNGVSPLEFRRDAKPVLRSAE